MGGIEIKQNSRDIRKTKTPNRGMVKRIFGRFKTSTAATVLTLGLTIAAPVILSGCTKQETEQTDKKPQKTQPEMKKDIEKEEAKPAEKKPAPKKTPREVGEEIVKAANEEDMDIEKIEELLKANWNGRDAQKEIEKFLNNKTLELVKAGKTDELIKLMRVDTIDLIRPHRRYKDIEYIDLIELDEIRDEDGKNLLIIASANGDAEIVEFLLKENVGIKERDNDGKSALDYAVEGNNKKIMNLISEEQKHLNEMLLMSAESGGYIYVKAFLDDGADTETKDEYGRTPLLLASSYGYGNIVEILLKAGADVKIQDKNGETALMFAAKSGSAEAIKELILHGADRFAENNDGENALMMVTWNGNEEAIEAMRKTKPSSF